MHDESPFELVMGTYSLFYRCKNYHEASHCMNRLNLKDGDYIRNGVERLYNQNQLEFDKEYHYKNTIFYAHKSETNPHVIKIFVRKIQ